VEGETGRAGGGASRLARSDGCRVAVHIVTRSGAMVLKRPVSVSAALADGLSVARGAA
jgi:hypothetical protein